jgi:hypothetical protein
MIHPHLINGEICQLVQPKHIGAKYNKGNLILVQPKHIGAKYNKENLIFRSSLWNSQGEPVSLSFKKFFNFDEQPDLCYKPFSLTANGGCRLIEKIDGSTLIVSQYKGKQIIRTRGTVDATKQQDNGYEIEFLKEKYPNAFQFFNIEGDPDFSLLYEWVSPSNRIVLNYGTEPDIYLIAKISHVDYSLSTQNELDTIAKMIGVKRPRTFNFASIKEMLEAVEELKGQEGLCVYCNKDQDIRKVKSAWYLALHRMKSEIGSFERIVDIFFTLPDYKNVSYNEFYQFMVTNFDFEIAEQCRGDISRICEGMKEVLNIISYMCFFVFNLKSQTNNRKEQAAKIQQAYGNTNRAGMMFNLLDGRDLKIDDVKKLLYQVLKK